VPSAIKEQAEKSKDGFVSILLESQGLPEENLLGFMVKRFPKNECMTLPGSGGAGLRTEPSSPGLPHAALIGADGTVVWAGRPGGSNVSKLIEAELKKIKEGWGKSKDAKKARQLMYGKGDLAGAAKLLESVKDQIKAEEREDYDAAVEELAVRYAAEKKSVTGLIEVGRYVDAQKNAVALLKSVKGHEAWEAEAAALVEGFKDPETDKQLKADAALSKIIKSWGDKAPKADAAGPLRKFGEKNQGTKAAERAFAYAAACEFNPN
jgi:hypothetical protein